MTAGLSDGRPGRRAPRRPVRVVAALVATAVLLCVAGFMLPPPGEPGGRLQAGWVTRLGWGGVLARARVHLVWLGTPPSPTERRQVLALFGPATAPWWRPLRQYGVRQPTLASETNLPAPADIGALIAEAAGWGAGTWLAMWPGHPALGGPFGGSDGVHIGVPGWSLAVVGTPAAGAAAVAAHELAETITDPWASGWTARGWTEVADLCERLPTRQIGPDRLPALWSDHLGRCSWGGVPNTVPSTTWSAGRAGWPGGHGGPA